MGFPGKNTEVGCHFPFQQVFLTQGWNTTILYWQADSLPLNHQGSPYTRVACDQKEKKKKNLQIYYPLQMFQRSFWMSGMARGSVSWPGIEPLPTPVEAQSLNHWTAREISEVQLVLFVWWFSL